MNNQKEFDELIKAYKSITLEKILEVMKSYNIKRGYWFGRDVMSILTGFNNQDTCTLCLAISNGCEDCIWRIKTDSACCEGCNEDSYKAIECAKNEHQLLKGIAKRIARMEEIKME